MTPIFDFNQITIDMEMDQEDILHLMTIYQQELRKDLTELSVGLTEQDWLQIKSKLHKMKGDASNLCLLPLAESFTAMEHACQDRNAPLLQNQLDAVQSLSGQFTSAFQSYSAETRPSHE